MGGLFGCEGASGWAESYFTNGFKAKTMQKPQFFKDLTNIYKHLTIRDRATGITIPGAVTLLRFAQSLRFAQ
jgi:hypothetical protein